MKAVSSLRAFVARIREGSQCSWPSTAALVGANLVPLAGVVWLGWKASNLLILFWAENVVLCAFTLLKLMVVCRGLRLLMIPTVAVLYFAFAIIHGAFVMSFPIDLEAAFRPVPMERRIAALLDLRWAIAAFVLSHGVSFAWHFIVRGEYCRSDPDTLAKAPLPRALVLQLTAAVGGMACIVLQNPATLLAILLLGKTVLDLRSHLREHGFWTPGKAES